MADIKSMVCIFIIRICLIKVTGMRETSLRNTVRVRFRYVLHNLFSFKFISSKFIEVGSYLHELFFYTFTHGYNATLTNLIKFMYITRNSSNVSTMTFM